METPAAEHTAQVQLAIAALRAPVISTRSIPGKALVPPTKLPYDALVLLNALNSPTGRPGRPTVAAEAEAGAVEAVVAMLAARPERHVLDIGFRALSRLLLAADGPRPRAPECGSKRDSALANLRRAQRRGNMALQALVAPDEDLNCNLAIH